MSVAARCAGQSHERGGRRSADGDHPGAWQAYREHGGRLGRVVQQRVEIPVASVPRDVGGWAELIEQLTARLAQGCIHKRDLDALVPAINHLLEVMARRLRE